MAENEKVLTDKTGQELIKATKDLNKSIQDLSKVQTKAISTTATATDIMKKTGSQGAQPENPILGVDGTSKHIKREDPIKDYFKKSLTTLKDILKVNKEQLANSMKHLGRGLGSLLALGGLLGYLFTGKVELLYATAKGFIKGFIMPITKVIDFFVMNFAKNMLANGSKIFAGLNKIFSSIGKKFTSVFVDIGKNFSKVFGGMAKNLLKSIGLGGKVGKKISKGVKTITRYRNAAGKFVKKGTEGAIKEVVEVGSKTVGKKIALEGAEALGKTVGAKGASALLKSGGKLGLKALSKIPILGIILGPVVGIMFAIQRWKKGDYIGALIEVGSGLASMIPILGIPISLAIDIFMAFRDVKNSPEDIKKQNENAGKVVKSKAFAGNVGLKLLARIPLFGAIIRPMLAIQKWKKGDKVGALMEVGSGLASLIPGIGIPISMAIDAVGAFRDAKLTKEEDLNAEQKVGEQIDQSAKKAKSWNMMDTTKKQGSSYFAPMPSIVPSPVVAPSVPTVVQPPVVAPSDTTTPSISYDVMNKKWSMVNTGDADIDLLQEQMKGTKKPKIVEVDIKKYNVPISPESFMAQRQYPPQEHTRVVNKKEDLIRNPFIFRKGAKLKGTLPIVEQKFTEMARKFVSDTNNPIAINSGYRSYDEQKALYLKYKAEGKGHLAANPDDEFGRPKKNPTPHIAGKAIDVDSHVGDYLEKSGLLEAHGFYRPLMQRAGQPPNILEPWHIQAKPSLVGDADTEMNVSNPEAINAQSYATNMDKMNTTTDMLHSAIRELIEVTRESNAKLQKTIGSQKITNKQTLSVNSLG